MHPDRSAVGRCASCGRPFCAGCRVEDVAADLAFCSPACLATGRPDAQERDAAAERLIDGVRAPIRTGWKLWLRSAGALSVRIALPLGLAYGLLEWVLVGSGGEADASSGALSLALLLLGSLGAASSAVTLSRAHTGAAIANPWPLALARFVPWAMAWLIFAGSVLFGLLLLVVPGMILGARLFWADEFALMHRSGPLAAVRESFQLTRGIGGRVFGFQFVLGLAEYLPVLPLLVGLLAVQGLLAPFEPGPVTMLLGGALHAVLLVNFYASVHAPEVVYFYGLRALRAGVPPDALEGDWVARALQARAGAGGSAGES